MLEDLERTPSLENNKAQLTPPRTAYREIKHHDDITQQGDDYKSLSAVESDEDLTGQLCNHQGVPEFEIKSFDRNRRNY